MLAAIAGPGYAAAEDYPAGNRSTMWTEGDKFRVGSFRHMSDIYFSRRIRHPSMVSALPKGEPLKLRALDDYLTDSLTTGFLVMKDGKIVYERYALGADQHSLLTSWSMAKSITSTLIGFAIGDGLIKSVDDPIDKYVPELKDSGYAGVPIKAILQMSSGIDFNEEYDTEDSDSADMWDATIGNNDDSFTEVLQDLERGGPPFAKFNYVGVDTLALGLLLRKVTGRSLSDYLSAKLWEPLGMESDATWNLDSDERDANEAAFCCINAVLRDYARFGQFILNEGAWQGEQLLPKTWVHEATTPDMNQIMPGHLHPGWDVGYQYQWWIMPPDQDWLHGFEAQGVNGQFIYVNPEEQLVMVVTSAWPNAADGPRWERLHSLFWNIVKALR
jgi:CubicO group peptidase (beta-lactamase class C family)